MHLFVIVPNSLHNPPGSWFVGCSKLYRNINRCLVCIYIRPMIIESSYGVKWDSGFKVKFYSL